MTYRWLTNLQSPPDDVDGNFLNVLHDYRLGPPVPTLEKDRRTLVLNGIMGVYTTIDRVVDPKVNKLTMWSSVELTDIQLGEEYENLGDVLAAGRLQYLRSDPARQRNIDTASGDSVLQRTPEGSPMSLADLFRANEHVNHSVAYRTDQDVYGEIDKWEYPRGQGDCEDFALAKRQLLIAGGYDPKLLNIAICLDHSGKGHAVLAATLDGNDYVLDNQTDDVLHWNQCHYQWIKITRDGSFKHWDLVG
jgi:predicted transglutaminase-like cysteine proteinase